MTPVQFYRLIIARSAPALFTLDSPQARCLLLAIAGQESAWSDRLQVPGDYARGFWQCEMDGAVAAALLNPKLAAVCLSLSIPLKLGTVFEAIAWNDRLAYAVARLTLWNDPAPLPHVGDSATSWSYYVRNWRPGKPDSLRWGDIYRQSIVALGEVG